MNLLLLLLIPLATLLVMLPVKGLKAIRSVSLAGTTAQLGLSLYLLWKYLQVRNSAVENMYFQQKYTWFGPLQIDFHLGVDGVSVGMILLTAIVVMAGVLVSWKQEKWSKEFFFLLILLSMGAYGFFVSLDLFTLFFFLEVAVIPKFLLIGIWGSGKKEYSAMKLALMLMGGSALVFVGLAGLYFNTNVNGHHSFSFIDIMNLNLSANMQRIFFPFLFVGFGVFTALFPFHTWVPDGHSSAPTAASMFLAGISMKLGGYGCLRVATLLMPVAAKEYAPVIIVLSAIAIIYGAFATMMQKDLKYINAYSSISHVGFVLLGIGMLTRTSIAGAVMQMISHGLITALFFAAIGMIYERTHTRDMAKLGGLLKVMPFISSVFVLAGLASLGLPGFSGFVAEMTIFVGAWENTDTLYRIATVLACASIVVTAVYVLRAVGKAIMGPLETQEPGQTLTDATWNEKLAGALLIAGILVIGMAPFWLNELIGPGMDLMIQKLTLLSK